MHENEMIVLLLGLAIGLGLILFRSHLKQVPGQRWLLAAFSFTLVSWLATVVEHFFAHSLFNLIEHAGIALTGWSLAAWCWVVCRKGSTHVHN